MSFTYLERCYQVVTSDAKTPETTIGGLGLFENSPALTRAAAELIVKQLVEDGADENHIYIVDATAEIESSPILSNSPWRFVKTLAHEMVLNKNRLIFQFKFGSVQKRERFLTN